MKKERQEVQAEKFKAQDIIYETGCFAVRGKKAL